MSLEEVDILELLDRYNFIVRKYATLATELAPKLDKFGKYKKELQVLTVEFTRRGIHPKDSEDLVSSVMDELNKRGISDNEDQTEGRRESEQDT